jgi:hypothetical protein
MAEAFRKRRQAKGAVRVDWEADFDGFVQAWMENEAKSASAQRGTGNQNFRPRERLRVATEDPKLSDEQWRAHLENYRISPTWDEAVLGPKPFKPGCFASPEIIEAVGVVDLAARRARRS